MKHATKKCITLDFHFFQQLVLAFKKLCFSKFHKIQKTVIGFVHFYTKFQVSGLNLRYRGIHWYTFDETFLIFSPPGQRKL